MKARTSTTIGTALATALLAAATAVRAADCNRNGRNDVQDIALDVSRDCNANLVPDECELAAGSVAYETARFFDTPAAGSVVLADLDGDADLEVVLNDHDTDTIVVLRNEGGGRFATPVLHPIGGEPYEVYARDLDGDGDLDLVALLPEAEDQAIAVLKNRGGGDFQSQLYAVSGRPVSGDDITADLDGDADLEIVTVNYPNGLSVLRNLGDAAFEPEVLTALPGAVYSILNDLDGDQDIDVAVITWTEEPLSSSLAVLLNAGDATFGVAGSHHLLEGRVKPLAAADLDGDGDADLLANSLDLPWIAIFKNQGRGAFERAADLLPGHTPGTFQASDLDEDGDLDLVSSGEVPDDIAVFVNQGGGTFAVPARHVVGDNPSRILFADANGDGRNDILVATSGYVAVLLGYGDGRFKEPTSFRVASARGLAAGDLDGDSDLDLATASLQRWSLAVLENVTGGDLTRGCGSFLRGDANSDGTVSFSDMVMLRRFFFEGVVKLTCEDAADVNDNDNLNFCDAVTVIRIVLGTPDWTESLSAPSPQAGRDPTPLATESTATCDQSVGPVPLGCAAYEVNPPAATSDVLRIGGNVAEPGDSVRFPVYVSAEVPVEAFQLVVGYDPEVLAFDPDTALSFEGTPFEQSDRQPMGVFTVHPEHRVFTVAASGGLFRSPVQVPPGRDVLVAWIHATVLPGTPSGAVSVVPTNGPDGEGVGPFHLRNELTYKGEARYLSLFPQVKGGVLIIVGDQILFIRGDSNDDLKVDMSDAIDSLGALFLGVPRRSCADAADANDDGRLDVSDAIFTLAHLFTGGEPLPAPYPGPGSDPTRDDDLFCLPAGTDRP